MIDSVFENNAFEMLIGLENTFGLVLRNLTFLNSYNYD